MSMLPRILLIGAVAAVPAVEAAAQPAAIPTTLSVDIAATNLRRAGDLATPPLTGGSGCSNRPITHDAAIWHLLLAARPNVAEYVPDNPIIPGYYVQPSRAGSIFVPVVDATATPVVIRTARHTYNSTSNVTNGRLQVVVGPMTLSELADLLAVLKGDAQIAAALAAVQASWTLYEVTGTAAAGAAPPSESDVYKRMFGDISLPGEYETVRQRLRQPHNATYTTRVAQPATALAVTGIDATLLATADRNVRSLSFLSGQGASPDGGPRPLFIVDEPCLAFSLSPVGTGEAGVNNALSFRGRYDFLSPTGSSFLKLRAEGNAAEGGKYYDRIEGTLDLGVNRQPAQGNVAAFSASGTYSYTRPAGQRLDEWRFVGKAQVNGPNLSEILGTLPGAGMAPLLSIEAGFAGGDGSTTATTDFLVRGNATAIARLTPRLSIDLRWTGAWSNEARFGGRDRFAYANAQLRVNLTNDWDYLVKWECGRKDPDYRDYCGTQSGVAVAVGR